MLRLRGGIIEPSLQILARKHNQDKMICRKWAPHTSQQSRGSLGVLNICCLNVLGTSLTIRTGPWWSQGTCCSWCGWSLACHCPGLSTADPEQVVGRAAANQLMCDAAAQPLSRLGMLYASLLPDRRQEHEALCWGGLHQLTQHTAWGWQAASGNLRWLQT